MSYGWDDNSAVPVLLEMMTRDGDVKKFGRIGWTAPLLPSTGDLLKVGTVTASVTGVRWEVEAAGGTRQLQRAVIEADLGAY